MAFANAAETSGVGTKQNRRCSNEEGIAIAIKDIIATHNSVRRTMRDAVGKHHTLWAPNGYHNGWQPMTWLSLGELGCY